MRVCCRRVENKEKNELCEKNERYGRIFIEKEQKKKEGKKRRWLPTLGITLQIATLHPTLQLQLFAMAGNCQPLQTVAIATLG